ncbi:MAG TPA: UDP-N-acetylmuramoyl-tripeptide--D-alanyl-D-alanine ligase [Burkholderiaceae bacterium]|jgi:UDP-N-acetylmuramoyl-tripeptide--D-alanyl-D-alanine ligase|nr:UDP-N-acetylmuramoyl-tripeptide--D-alanyl-D-alanine ligase [Burkholderiaceae bacterium]
MITLGELARAIEGATTDSGATRVESVSTDSRTLKAGALFVALRGPHFDGHDYVQQARRGGAAALMVERVMPLDCPQLRVADTRRALGRAAAHWRSGFSLPVVAVTGSNGKTTLTQMIGSIFAQAYGERDGRNAWLATRGNLNNDIGLPLMLFELAAHHRAAVFELGMNRVGEIAELAAIARPTLAVVNNAQREHQEFLQSPEATARENGAALAALPPDGIAVFPADDACAPIWRDLAGLRRIVDFAAQGPATVTAQVHAGAAGSQIRIATPAGPIDTALAVGGAHNVHNALAAAACCLGLGLAPEAIGAGLAAFRAVPGRGTRLATAHGAVVIDDSYNANPDSVRAAIDLLAAERPPRRLVLGDMGEVGHQGPAFHREIGGYAKARGIESLLATGPLSREAVAAFGAGARHFDDVESLIAAVRPLLAASGAVLVKGSRFMRMERVVQAIAGGTADGH